MTENGLIKTSTKERLGFLSNLFAHSLTKTKRYSNFEVGAVNKLSVIMGEEFPDLMDRYFSVISELTLNLEVAISQKNYTDIARAAHTIRSPSSQIGAVKVSIKADEIEELARENGSIKDIAEKFAVLCELINQVNSELRHYIAGKSK